MKTANGDWIEIESSLDKVEETVEEVLCRVNGHDLPNEKLFGLRLALHEAIANAITHGNRNRSDRSVCIRYERSENRVEITVRDEGHGFNCEKVPDPTVGENIYQCSGRGIFLMRRLVDEVNYNDPGNQVTLVVRYPRDPRISAPPDSCDPPAGLPG